MPTVRAINSGPLRRLLTLALVIAASPVLAASAPPSPYAAIRSAQRKVVKIYGAGGLSQMEAYQTGILVSPAGHVLTVLSYVLDTDDVVAVLDDGRRLKAEFVGSDPVLELAVLKLDVEGESVEWFDLAGETRSAVPGERVLAVSNLYGIAAGDEAASAMQGVVAAVAPLEARRGAYQASYHGRAYMLDLHANNPGAAGGALVDWNGRLLGLLGKELRSRTTGAWLNYALPTEAWAGSAEALVAGRTAEDEGQLDLAPDEPLTLRDLGVVMVPNLIARTPPFVDAVQSDSAAASAGLRADDLVVFVAGEPTASCDAVVAALAKLDRRDAVKISVLRDGELVDLELAAGE